MSLTVILAAAAASQLRIVEPVDPVDDTRSAFAMLQRGKTYLAVGCLDVTDRSSIAVMAKFERFVDRETPGILSGGTGVQYRFDQRPHETERWTSRRYTVSARGGAAIRFILAMKGSRQIYLRAQRYDAALVHIAFSYGDPSRFIDTVLARCGYNPDGSRTGGARRN